MEGIECAAPEQHRGLTLTSKTFGELAQRYSGQLQEQMGIRIDFHQIAGNHARYLIRYSIEFLNGQPGLQHLHDFLKFAGEEPQASPFADLSEIDTDGTFFHDPYFERWIINPHEIQPLADELRNLEKGTIILTGAPLLERQQTIIHAFVSRYFSPYNRKLWSYLFGKAAFYLKGSNAAVAGAAYKTARMLDDDQVPLETIRPVWILFEKTLEIVKAQEKAKEEEERKTSLIVTPEEFERQRRR
jgi:hypothetical protein